MRTGNLEWRDTTTYSQATPKEERVPTMWSLTRQRYTLTVFCKGGATNWYLCCREQSMWDVPVGYTGADPEKACDAAAKLFHQMARRRAADQLKVARDAQHVVRELSGGAPQDEASYFYELPMSV